MKRILSRLILFATLSSTVSVSAATALLDPPQDPPQAESCPSFFGIQSLWPKAGALAGAAMIATTLMPTDSFAQTSNLQRTPDGKIVVNVCGGGPNGTYKDTARYIVRGINGRTPWEGTARQTLASLDNIERMQKDDVECHISVAQIDTIELYVHQNPASTFRPAYISEKPVLQEELHTLCRRQLQIRTVKDIAAKKIPIYVESNYSGASITIPNLIRVNPDDFAGIVTREVSEETPGNSPKEKAFNAALRNNACVAYVTKAPDDLLLRHPKLAAEFNLVDMWVGKEKNWQTSGPKPKPMYEVIQYSDIDFSKIDRKKYPNLPEDPYLPFRQGDPNAWLMKGGFDPYTYRINAHVVIDEIWRSEMEDAVRASNQGGLLDRIWNKALADVTALQGDFGTHMTEIEKIKVEPFPQ